MGLRLGKKSPLFYSHVSFRSFATLIERRVGYCKSREDASRSESALPAFFDEKLSKARGQTKNESIKSGGRNDD
jgi:hypothetical protein